MARNPGKKPTALRWTIIIAALLVVTIIALPFIVDANQFRPEIESRLTDALGREVKLGNLKLSLLSGSVKIDDISIADNPAFNSSPFLVSKSFRAGIELKPLILSREIRITGISLDRPEIILVRSSAGKWNFSDLGNTTGDDRRASSGDSGNSPERAFSIRQARITGGRIAYIEGNRKPSIYDDVNLVVHGFSSSSSFPFTLTASLPGGGRLNLEGNAGPLHKSDAVLTPVAAELKVDELNLVESGFVTPDSGISGILSFKGTLTSDGRRVQSSGDAEADHLQFVRGGSPAGKPISMGYAVDYDLASRKGALRSGEIKIAQAVANINGEFSKKGENALLKMRVFGADMPVQDLVPLLPAFGVTFPRGATLEGGILDVDITATGPVEQMVTAGTAEISGTRLTGFDLAGKVAALASLTGIQSSNVTDIETLASDMRMTHEGIRVSDILLIMPSLGKLSGSGRINPDQSLDFTLQAVLKPSGTLGAGLGWLLKKDMLSIPFFVRGTSSDPKFELDAKNAAAGFLKSGPVDGDSKETQTDTDNTVGDILNNLLRK